MAGNFPVANGRIAPLAALAGAVGSVWFTLLVGRHNPSRLLVAMFLVWVLAPFIALAFTKWALPVLTVLIALASLAIYGRVALGPPTAQPAFAFLVVPLASWLVIALAAFVAH